MRLKANQRSATSEEGGGEYLCAQGLSRVGAHHEDEPTVEVGYIRRRVWVLGMEQRKQHPSLFLDLTLL